MDSWTVSPDSKKILKYMVLVKLIKPGGNFTKPGILLNERYVLTPHYTIIFYGEDSLYNVLKIVVDYHGNLPSSMKGKEYYVDLLQYYHNLVLIRTSGKIAFGPTVGCIKLPSESDASFWKNPPFVPNHQEIISSCWRENGNRTLQLRKGIRKCDSTIIYSTPKHLIPTCLVRSKNTNQKSCWEDLGLALSYNDTLIGIRLYYGQYAPEEHNSTKYDLFYNVAFFWDWLQETMIHYTPCV